MLLVWEVLWKVSYLLHIFPWDGLVALIAALLEQCQETHVLVCCLALILWFYYHVEPLIILRILVCENPPFLGVESSLQV